MAERDSRTSPNTRLLRPDALALAGSGGSIRGALSVSVVTHVFGFLLLAIAVSRLPHDVQRSAPIADRFPQVVWLPQAGAPRGGGGSGKRDPEPPRRMELPGRETSTLPAASASTLTDSRPVVQELQVPAMPTTADVRELPGIVTNVSVVSAASLGPGAGDRGGQGEGSGSGPGLGPGEGPGRNGGHGGDAYQIGNGVVGPRLIREVKPAYTAEAMRARIQGTVILEAVVLPDGAVGQVRIVRSLDGTFGLDNEALSAVKEWRFAPGTRAGRTVPVLVTIELAFTLR